MQRSGYAKQPSACNNKYIVMWKIIADAMQEAPRFSPAAWLSTTGGQLF